MTTNCIQKPRETYKKRIFTSGADRVAGSRARKSQRLQPGHRCGLGCSRIHRDGPDDTIMVGFGHHAVLGVAPIRSSSREGRRDQALLPGRRLRRRQAGPQLLHRVRGAVPKDSIILTLACGKYRFNELDFGDIGGIPRLLDIGQCNDAYSAIQIALALAARSSAASMTCRFAGAFLVRAEGGLHPADPACTSASRTSASAPLCRHSSRRR